MPTETPFITLESIPNPIPNLAKVKWTESLTSRSTPTTVYLINQALDFVGYALVLNAFSMAGNFDDTLPSGWLYTLIGIASTATLFSMIFCKLPELGNENETLHLNQHQQRFFDNLEMQVENSYIEDAPLILCLDITNAFPSQSGGIPKNFVDGIQLLHNKYFSKTGRRFKLCGPNMELEAQIEIEKPDDKRILIITNVSTSLQKYSENTRIIHFYETTWIKRISNDYNTSLNLASQTALKGSLTFLNWTVSRAVPGLQVVLTGIHALCGVTTTKSWDSKILRAIALAAYTAISLLGKGLINNRLKGDDTARELRQLAESIWHKKYYTIKAVPLLVAILISMVSMYPYSIATPITFTKGGLQTIVDELNAIFPGLSMELSTTVLDINIISSIATSLLLAVTTSTLPCYRAFAQGVHFGNNTAKTATKRYRKTWIVFIMSSIVDSLVYANNAYYNMRKCWKFLVERSPEFAKLANHWETASSIITAVGVCILAIYWCLYKGVDKFENCMEVSNEVNKMIRHSRLGRKFGLYQEDERRENAYLALEMKDSGDPLASRSPTPLRPLHHVESTNTLRHRALSFTLAGGPATPSSFNC